MTILITGFDAFGGADVNISQLVVEELADIGQEDLVTAVLPTSYRKAGERIRELIRAHRPDWVLMFGLASDTKSIRLERAALNFDDCAAPDNDGEVRLQQRIAEQAPPSHRSSLPLSRMAEIARDFGHHVQFSLDAGGFVCNHVFFEAAHLVHTELPDSRCGFVHLPLVTEPGEELDRILRIVQAWISDSAFA
ncbi:MAG: pyroglutamyl-peptidase I [Pseudomonadota bacterium]